MRGNRDLLLGSGSQAAGVVAARQTSSTFGTNLVVARR
jgi:hypothetical protein